MFGGPGPPRYIGTCQGKHRVGFCCERSARVSHPTLALRFNSSLWLRRQLKHCSALTLAQECQERDLAVRKFQCIVMSDRLFLVDLPEDRRLVINLFRAGQSRALDVWTGGSPPSPDTPRAPI